MSFGALLEQLQAAEGAGVAAYQAVRALRAAGLARPSDFTAYDRLRADLFATQAYVVGQVSSMIATVDPDLVSRIPTPKPLPQVDMTHAGDAVGLGNPAFLIAAALIGLLELAALTWILSEIITVGLATYESVTRVKVRAQQYQNLLQARQAAYTACVQARGTTEGCILEAQGLTPTPEDAGLTVGDRGRERTSWAPVIVGGLALLGLGGLGWYIFRRVRAPRTVRGLGAPRRVADLDGSKSRYNLEV